jgi:hypothetical protein
MGKKQGGREGAERIQPSRALAGEDRGQEAEEFETEWQPGEPIKTVFLFGSGICAGSWDPVRRAILDVDPKAPVEVSTTPAAGERHSKEIACANESANFWFADHVHSRRRLEAFLEMDAQQLVARGLKQDYEKFRDVVLRRRAAFAKADRKLKAAIVLRLKEAVKSGTLRVTG